MGPRRPLLVMLFVASLEEEGAECKTWGGGGAKVGLGMEMG